MQKKRKISPKRVDEYREHVRQTIRHVGIDPDSQDGKFATREIIFTLRKLTAEIVAKLFDD